ncbi:MAG TPA: hypothetical protein PLF40_05830 [Kofleriaceae bacterium]|nr:hypothetical protein [Kofleriaceae bacterium]
MKLMLRKHGKVGEASMPEFRRFTDEMMVQIVRDSVDRMTSVHMDTFQAWGKSFDDVYQIALANLDALPDSLTLVELQRTKKSAVKIYTWEDGYGLSRLLLPQLRRLETSSDVFALAVDDRQLMVAQANDDEVVAVMVALAAKFVERGMVSSQLLLRQQGQWSVHQLAEAHPAYSKLLALQRLHLAHCYGAMNEKLQAESAGSMRICEVGTLRANDNPDRLRAVTLTPLEGPPPWAVPVADFVAIPADDGFFHVRWEAFFETLESELAPMGVYPERYVLRTISDEQMAELSQWECEPELDLED